MSDLPKIALNFFINLVFIFITTMILLVILYSSDTISTVPRELIDEFSIWSGISNYSQHADSWNNLAIIAIASGITLLWSLISIFTELFFRQHIVTNKQSKRIGFWLLHKLTTSVLTFFAILIFCNLILMAYEVKKSYEYKELKNGRYPTVVTIKKGLNESDEETWHNIKEITNAAISVYDSSHVKYFYIISDSLTDSTFTEFVIKEISQKTGVKEKYIKLNHEDKTLYDGLVNFIKYNRNKRVIFVGSKYQMDKLIIMARYYEILPLSVSVQGKINTRIFFNEFLDRTKFFFDVFIFDQQPFFKRIKKRDDIRYYEPKHQALVAASLILFLTTILFFFRACKFVFHTYNDYD
ncbi:hypothetical protein [Marinigracilibium pacificum]|uniref:Uncharacterized protein n=1 Tax=Marinigracilibium pacificum TaxID=2729599 RepID=A0A848J0I1_9BACT|nr:hypothetical protein [Marinigracilibium pacificum]NMM50293.1 hypothetical protein [Marinigracilibium pacificum]